MDLEGMSLEDLVRKARSGSREALEEVVRRVQGRVYALSLRMLYHPADAEDASQEILIKVITNLQGFRFQGPFEAWVMRVAANHLKTARRLRSKRLVVDWDQAQDRIDRTRALGWLSQPPAAPEPMLEAEMAAACTQGLLLCLDRGHRLAFILGVVMGLDSRQGGYVLDITPQAFRKRLSRARRRVMDFLRANCGLFDQDNDCQCGALVQGHVSRGWVRPDKLMFAPRQGGGGDLRTLRDYMRQLDELGRLAAMFAAYPDDRAPRDFAAHIKDILKARRYQVLDQPAPEPGEGGPVN